MTHKKLIAFEDVLIDTGINPRYDLDQSAVEDYAACIEELPPMVVFEVEGAGYVLTRGFHRIEAHKLAGRAEAEFVVKQGTLAEAKHDAYHDNLANGVRMTNDERRRVYEYELQTDPLRGDDKIAKVCKTTPDRIKEVRRNLERSGLIPVIQPALFPNGSNGYHPEPTQPLIDPYKDERPWYENRRKTTLDERLLPCQCCGYAISVRAHLLDVRAWGENPHTRQFCVRCHELYDIMVAVVERKGETIRADLLLEVVVKALGDTDPMVKELSSLAIEMAGVRKTLWNNRLEGLRHRGLIA